MGRPGFHGHPRPIIGKRVGGWYDLFRPITIHLLGTLGSPGKAGAQESTEFLWLRAESTGLQGGLGVRSRVMGGLEEEEDARRRNRGCPELGVPR